MPCLLQSHWWPQRRGGYPLAIACRTNSTAAAESRLSIGLEFSLKGLREAGWRPIALFASATVVNIVVALGLAVVLFGNVTVG